MHPSASRRCPAHRTHRRRRSFPAPRRHPRDGRSIDLDRPSCDTYYTGVRRPVTRPSDSQDFRFGLGHPVLEFLATCAGRKREPLERLVAPSDLARWLTEAGIVDGARCSSRLIGQARELREAIYRVLDAARGRRRPRRADLELLNRWARQPTQTPQLDSSMHQTWVGPDPARAALARLAAGAIELISGPDLARVRNCSSPTCSLLFIDRSRPGRRRWCSMERCGNRAKTARYRLHRPVGPSPPVPSA
jgi:predicted RNA-binding Zn ribbon-like protein